MLNPPLRLLGAFQQETDEEPAHVIKLDERQMWVAAQMNTGIRMTVVAVDKDARVTFDRSSVRRKQTSHKRKLPAWSYYMAGAVSELDRRGLDLQGATLVIAGDEPLGPRYEHALGIAFCAFWHHINETTYDSETLMDMMEAVRQGYLP
ncbi:MAG: hypothetical protein AAFQ07_05175 [Chloroflexota bacterium]